MPRYGLSGPLKDKYPTANYFPDSEYKYCKGTGERYVKKLDLTTCCICIYVGGVDRETREAIAASIGKTARAALLELKANR